MKSTWILVLALLTAPQVFAENDCVFSADYVSAGAKPLPAASFAAISKNMLTSEILMRLGPAARDIGSGLYVLEWKTTNGRLFRVSTASLCSKPISLGFGESESSNAPLRDPRSGQRASER